MRLIVVKVKVGQTKHLAFRDWSFLSASRLIEGVRLPGAYMNLWMLLVSEVPKQEDITIIVVAWGSVLVVCAPSLMQSDTIEICFDRMPHDIYSIKADIYTPFAVKDGKKAIQIFTFTLFLVSDFVWQFDAVFGALRNHFTSNDKGIVAENLLKKILVFLVVGRAETLHIVENELTAT